MKKEDESIWEKRDEEVEEFLRESLDKKHYLPLLGGRQTELVDPNARLIHSIRRASQSADRLSKKVVWLNWTLVILGTLGLIVAGYGVFFK